MRAWAKTELKFLGMILNRDGVTPDPAKVNGLKLIPIPVNKKDVQSFLGVINFYRTFVPNFAELKILRNSDREINT